MGVGVGEGVGVGGMGAMAGLEEAEAGDLARAWAQQMENALREHLGEPEAPPAGPASAVPGALGALVACIFLGSLMAFFQLILQNTVRRSPPPPPPPPPPSPCPHSPAPL